MIKYCIEIKDEKITFFAFNGKESVEVSEDEFNTLSLVFDENPQEEVAAIVPYSKMTNIQLIDLCEQKGIDCSLVKLKVDYIALLEEFDQKNN